MKAVKTILNARLLSFLFCISIIILNPSCKKDIDNPNPSFEEDDKDTNSDVFTLTQKDLLAVEIPAIDADDNVYMIYVGDAMLDAQSTIICIGADNKGKWEMNIDEPVTSLVLNNDKLIATAYEKIYALNTSDGNIAWTYQLTQPNTITNTKANHKPCIDSNGNIIVAMDSYLEEVLKEDAVPARIVSLSPSGNANWEYVLSTGDLYHDRYSKLCEPVFVSGKIFVTWYYSDGTDNFVVVALNSSGEKVNEEHIGSEFHAGKIICANKTGQIYVYGAIDMEGCEVKLLESDLSLKWNLSIDDRISPDDVILDAESNIYFNCEDGKMYKYNSSGAKVWEHNHGKIFVRGNLILGNDNNIYKMSQGLEKINAETGQVETIKFDGGYGAAELSMRNNGDLVVATILDKVYFLETKSDGLNQKAHWPKSGKDYSNSSSIN